MMDTLQTYCLNRLGFEEGFFPKITKDTNGFDTIGHGHKVMPDEYEKFKDGISGHDAGLLLQEDFDKHWKDARKIPEWRLAPDFVKAVLFDMTYQMGLLGVLNFKTTRKYIALKYYKAAAAQLMKSKYAKKDSPHRAERNKKMLETGTLV